MPGVKVHQTAWMLNQFDLAQAHFVINHIVITHMERTTLHQPCTQTLMPGQMSLRSEDSCLLIPHIVKGDTDGK